MEIEIVDFRRDKSAFEESDGPLSQSKSNGILTRDSLYGDGFFTTVLIENGFLLHLELHLLRLKESAKRLMFVGIEFEQLKAKLAETALKVGNGSGRISVTRKQAVRGYAIAKSSDNIVCIQIFDRVPREIGECVLIEAKTPISINPYLAGIKHLNRLDNVLAATEVSSNNEETIMFNGDQLISGSRSNLFVLMNDQWHTPDLSMAGIEGITKHRAIEIMKNNGLCCKTSQIFRQDIDKIKAAFITNSLINVWPAKRLFGRAIDISESLKVAELLER